jgi:hypothetical protein
MCRTLKKAENQLGVELKRQPAVVALNIDELDIPTKKRWVKLKKKLTNLCSCRNQTANEFLPA